MARDRKRQQDTDLQERVVYIHRVSKTVKGGRRMSLVALVVVGDGKGNVGIGQGRSAEVSVTQNYLIYVDIVDKRSVSGVRISNMPIVTVIGHFGVTS